MPGFFPICARPIVCSAGTGAPPSRCGYPGVVELMAFDTARLDGVYITQHEEGRVSSVQVDVKTDRRKVYRTVRKREKRLEGLSWRIKVTDPGRRSCFEGLCPEEAVTENPRLLVAQWLRKLAFMSGVELLCDGCVLDS